MRKGEFRPDPAFADHVPNRDQEVTAAQKSAVLEAYNLPPGSAEADAILREAFGIKRNEPCNSDKNPRIAKAQEALYRDIAADPGAYKDRQRVAEFSFVGEVMALRRRIDEPFISGNIPDVTLDEWLEQGRQEQEVIIQRYGEAFGAERVRLAVTEPIGHEREDDLAARLSWQDREKRKPVLAMTKEEIENEYARGRVNLQVRKWVLGR